MINKFSYLAGVCLLAGALHLTPALAGEFTNWNPADRQGDGTGGGEHSGDEPLPAGVDVPMGEAGVAAGSNSNEVASPIARVKPKAPGNPSVSSPIAKVKPKAKAKPRTDGLSPFTGDSAHGGRKCKAGIPRMCNNGSLAVMDGSCRLACPEDFHFRDGP